MIYFGRISEETKGAVPPDQTENPILMTRRPFD